MGERESTDESDRIEEEVEGLMEVLTRVDLDLAYSSEKLVNLNGLLMQISARETEHDKSLASAEFMEKALVFGLLSGVLDSEVRELDNFTVSLEAGILDAHRNISSCRHFAILGDKLSDSRESLLQTRKQVSELKTQSAKLQRTSQALAHGKCEAEEESESGEDLLGKLSGQRHILHMLEKSLARELDLEKKLSESRRREEELRGKLRYAEQSAFHEREDTEAIMVSLLEADCSSAAFEGVSRDLLSRLQRSRAELELKDMALGVASGSSQARAAELEALVESLRESVEIADTRAESAELKVAELIGTNVELTEELGFLKEGVGSTEKKFGGLEKQLREAEIQLQHAKASSEASQEQQNMLYAAIWDMETLIEDLKSKVAKAEAKTEAAEENCIALSETNAELTVEIGVLRDRAEELEASLEEAKDERIKSANEVDARTKLVMDMVARLASERERIQKQLNALTKENENFAKTLGFKTQNGSSGLENGVKEADDTEPRSLLINSSCSQSYLDGVKESSGKSSQAVQ